MPELQETTVVIACDHNIVREGLAALCADAGLRVIGQCSNGAEAVEMIMALKPDFAILDVNLATLTGLEVVQRLRAVGCTTKLLILSMGRDGASVSAAIRAGADAYLLKDEPARQIFDAMNFVRNGGIYISPGLKGAGFSDPMAAFSPREMEIYALLVNGKSINDISDLLEMSPKTVATYRASLLRKLNVRYIGPNTDEGGGPEGGAPLVPRAPGPRPTLPPLTARAKPPEGEGW